MLHYLTFQKWFVLFLSSNFKIALLNLRFLIFSKLGIPVCHILAQMQKNPRNWCIFSISVSRTDLTKPPLIFVFWLQRTIHVLFCGTELLNSLYGGYAMLCSHWSGQEKQGIIHQELDGKGLSNRGQGAVRGGVHHPEWLRPTRCHSHLEQASSGVLLGCHCIENALWMCLLPLPLFRPSPCQKPCCSHLLQQQGRYSPT